MNIHLEEKVGARFKLTTSKSDGRITKETGWFDNVVLDVGIERMISQVWGNGVAVGSGSSAPNKTQTQLDSPIAFTTTLNTSSSGREIATEPYYEWIRLTYRFGEGVAAGNISEVGIIFQNASTLWNRALIRDTEGNPTTITVLSDEFLDVTVEIRHYFQSKFTATVPYLNKQGVKIRDIPVVISPYLTPTNGAFTSQVSMTNINLYSGISNQDDPAAVPNSVMGSLVSGGIMTKISPNSFRSVCKLSLTQGNGSIKSVLFRLHGYKVVSASNSSGYKVEFETPIEKTTEMEISFTMVVTLSST